MTSYVPPHVAHSQFNQRGLILCSVEIVNAWFIDIITNKFDKNTHLLSTSYQFIWRIIFRVSAAAAAGFFFFFLFPFLSGLV